VGISIYQEKRAQSTDQRASSHYTNMQIRMEMIYSRVCVSPSRLRTSTPASVSWQPKESTSRDCLQRVRWPPARLLSLGTGEVVPSQAEPGRARPVLWGEERWGTKLYLWAGYATSMPDSTHSNMSAQQGLVYENGVYIILFTAGTMVVLVLSSSSEQWICGLLSPRTARKTSGQFSVHRARSQVFSRDCPTVREHAGQMHQRAKASRRRHVTLNLSVRGTRFNSNSSSFPYQMLASQVMSPSKNRRGPWN